MEPPPVTKRVRSSSTPIHEQQVARVVSHSLLSLPLELVTYIIDQVKDSRDLRALSKTCRALYRPCSLRGLVAHFADEKGLTTKLYCLEPAQPGDLGFQPFVIINAAFTPDEQDVLFDLIELSATTFNACTPTRSYNCIEWTQSYVELVTSSADLLMDVGKHAQTSWIGHLRGQLSVMVTELMDERFICPECGNARSVEFGSRSFNSRWPDLPLHDFYFDIDCPRCTVSELDAYAIIQEIFEEFHRPFSPFYDYAHEDEEAFSFAPSAVEPPKRREIEHEESSSSDGDTDWDPSEEETENEKDEERADADGADLPLLRDLEESFRALEETWPIEDDDQSSTSSSFDIGNDSDTSSTPDDDEPSDTIDFHAEAEVACRAREEEDWYEEVLSAMDDQYDTVEDWWGSGEYYEEDWAGDERWVARGEGWQGGEECYDIYDDYYGLNWDGGRLQYVKEQSRGGKSGREERWYEAEEEQGVFWW